jgi:hypothetical protein
MRVWSSIDAIGADPWRCNAVAQCPLTESRDRMTTFDFDRSLRVLAADPRRALQVSANPSQLIAHAVSGQLTSRGLDWV